MCQQGFCMLQGYAPQTLLYMWVTQRYFKMQILTSEVQGEAWGSYISNKFPDEARVTVPPHLECYLSKNWGFPGGTSGKEPACQCGRHKRHGFDPWVGKIPWRRHGNPLQYSCLKNSCMDIGAWWATVHMVTNSWTWLKQFSTYAYLSIWFFGANVNGIVFLISNSNS